MSLSTILLIAIPIALMVLMHGVGHGGHGGGHGFGRRRAVHEHDAPGTSTVDGQSRDPEEQGHQHGRRGGCC